MIIVGERINTSSKVIPVAQAVIERNTDIIAKQANDQLTAGATFIDVNCGTLIDNEPESLEWLVKTVQGTTQNAPCSIDSPNPSAIERALKVHQGKAIINSITGEKERIQGVLPLVRDYKTGIVALTMDDNGMPETPEDRLRIAEELVGQLTGVGVAMEDIYLDPMVRPVSTGDHYGMVVFQTLQQIRQEFPGVHTICGLSNISYGLPARKILNQAFLIMAIQAGLDSAILNPLDQRLMASIYAAELLVQKDEYAMNYITAFREGKFE